MIKRIVSILTLVVMVIVMVTSTGSTTTASTRHYRIDSDQLAQYDVTDTNVGQRVATEAADRFEERYDININPKNLRVYDVARDQNLRDLLVAPKSMEIDFVKQRIGPDEKRHLSVRSATVSQRQAKAQSGNSGGANASIQAESYPLVAGECFARYYEKEGSATVAWSDHCYKLHKYSGQVWNGEAYRDLFALFHYTTAKSVDNNWWLTKGSIWNSEHGNSDPMEWSDWDPRSDQKFDCFEPVTLGFSYGGASVSYSWDVCDTWNITKYSEPGVFRNDWEGSALNSEREVAYGVEVYVPVDGWPQWYLYTDLEVVLNKP